MIRNSWRAHIAVREKESEDGDGGREVGRGDRWGTIRRSSRRRHCREVKESEENEAGSTVREAPG